jgi:hypothetical protein
MKGTSFITPCTCLTHIGEYVQVILALASNTPIAPFDKTMKILCFFHPPIEVDFSPFVDVFHTKVILDRETFIFVLACSSHLSSGGPSGMVYEFL